jgi:hypothetical protein
LTTCSSPYQAPKAPAYAEFVHLETVVFDAIDPQAFGRFSETALGTETLTDEADGFETRLAVPDGPVLSRLAGGGRARVEGPTGWR